MTTIREILDICKAHEVTFEETINGTSLKGINALSAIVNHLGKMRGMQWKDIAQYTDLTVDQIRGLL